MSIGTSHGSEDPFLCSICLNVFTDPVCTPCGHNFCKSCLDRSWEGDTICQCPVCKEIFLMKPELQVNSLISDLAEEFRRSSRNKMQNASNPEERVRCSRTGWMLHIPFLLVMSLCVYSQAGQIKDRLREIDAEMDRKIQQIQLKTKDSAAKMQLDFIFTFIDRQKVREEQVEGLMRELEELVIQVTDAFLMETLPTKKKEKISQVLTRLALSRARRYRADVTFDRDTAHRWLKVSDDGREVHFNDTLITHPDSPKRFSLRYAVLGQPGFSSGRFYFEVLVRGKTDWTLGVVTESVDRMENNSPTPQNGYWTIRLRNNHTYKGFGEDDVVLALHSRPEKIGVFVDYEERLVSFHDADSAALIYSYTSCFFAKKLHPYFSPSTDKAGRNSAPLVIIFP